MHTLNKTLLILLLTSGTAMAAEKPDFCRYVEKYHQPNGVEYQPGVDVHGKAVVPADLNSSVNDTYQDIVIPVEVNLIDRYNLHVPAGVKLKPVVADMTIHKDGRVSYNGHDLTDDAVALCGEDAEKSQEKVEKTDPAIHGQGDADDIRSETIKGKLIEGHSP